MKLMLLKMLNHVKITNTIVDKTAQMNDDHLSTSFINENAFEWLIKRARLRICDC